MWPFPTEWPPTPVPEKTRKPKPVYPGDVEDAPW